MSDKNDLTELARRAGRGDEGAFSQLYEATHQRVYYLARQILKDDTEALDVTQETFLNAWKGLPTLNYPETVVTWLYRIADNQCKGRLRKNTPVLLEDLGEQAPLETAEENESFLPQELLDSVETRRLVREMVDALPPLQRECIVLYYFAGLSVGEIAAQQACAEGTVKSRLNYGRQQIKAAVLALEKDEGTKLYSIAPLPLLLALFQDIPQGFLPGAEAFQALWTQVAAGAGLATAATAGGAAAAAGTQAGATAGAAAKTAGAALKMKIAAGALAATVAVGGTAALLTADKAITFTDPALETAVRLYLEQPSGRVTEKDVSEIYWITIDDGMWYFNQDAIRDVPDAERPVPVSEGMPTTFADLAQFSGLKMLDLKNLDLTDLSSLDGMDQLKKLGLRGLPDTVYQNLPVLTAVEHLELWPGSTCTEVRVAPAKPVSIQLQNPDVLLSLDLSGQERLEQLLANARFENLDFLSGAEHLQYLSLTDDYEQNTVCALAPIAQLKELRALTLHTYSVDDLAPLAGLPELEAVYLGINPMVDVPGISALDSAPSMKYLYVTRHEGKVTRCVSGSEEVQQALWDLYTAAGAPKTKTEA